MRNGNRSGPQHVPNRAARARAERLWREAVASPPAPSSAADGPDAAHLPLSPSPKGGGGTQAAPAFSPSPPLGEERAGVRWGRVEPCDPPHPANGTADEAPLPTGPVTRKLRALWISAFHLGLVRDSSDDALTAWLRRLASRDGDAPLAPDDLARAIRPLEAWLARAAGVDWRPHLSLGRNGHVREVRRPRARVLEAQWRILHRQGRVRIGSHAALGAYASRFAGLGRPDSHLALSETQADALIRHLGRCIREAGGSARETPLNRRQAQAPGRADPSASTSG
ncbi:MAG: DUF1018 domain-containing protein [Rhodospirillales bacterium]|nr:DUF1018 domain-containing protein [Rhodospirillales bacterium]MDE0381211.1 DUF1018 domain-containing protein [Rhodospirillales bacterium]